MGLIDNDFITNKPKINPKDEIPVFDIGLKETKKPESKPIVKKSEPKKETKQKNISRDKVLIKETFHETNYRKHIEFNFDFNKNPELRNKKLEELIDPKICRNAIIKVDIKGNEGDNQYINKDAIRAKLESCGAYKVTPINPSFVKERTVRNEEIKVNSNPKELVTKFVNSKKFIEEEDKKEIINIAHNIQDNYKDNK